MASKVINISLPEALLKEIDKVARKERRTRSEFLREAARRYIRSNRTPFSGDERDVFSQASAASFNRIWDNPVDAAVWDREETSAKNAKTR